MNALAAALLLLAASPDGGPVVVDMPRSAEHRALETQVRLMRAEVAKPRDWYDRDRATRLKADLAEAERALNRVEAIYTHKMDACRIYFLQTGRDPRTLSVDPGYFNCFEKPPVDDATVRAARRREEVARRLGDAALGPAARAGLRAELRNLEARLDREEGMGPLYMDESSPDDVDGGVPPVPQPAASGRAP